MTWKKFLPLVACALGVIFYVQHRNEPIKQQKNGREQSRAPDTRPAKRSASQHSGRDYFVPITGGRPRPLATIDPFAHIPKTREGLPLPDDPFVAESIPEQRWLDRNGYPNASQWSAYSAAPDVVLEQAAASGDSIATVMLAGRRLAHGDTKASGELMTAGMNGSSFALSLLAAYLVNGRYGNPELGYAVSRVIELRGDWRAGVMREAMFRAPLSAEQRARAESEAAKLLNDFRRHSRVQPYVDPRPLAPR